MANPKKQCSCCNVNKNIVGRFYSLTTLYHEEYSVLLKSPKKYAVGTATIRLANNTTITYNIDNHLVYDDINDKYIVYQESDSIYKIVSGTKDFIDARGKITVKHEKDKTTINIDCLTKQII